MEFTMPYQKYQNPHKLVIGQCDACHANNETLFFDRYSYFHMICKDCSDKQWDFEKALHHEQN